MNDKIPTPPLPNQNGNNRNNNQDDNLESEKEVLNNSHKDIPSQSADDVENQRVTSSFPPPPPSIDNVDNNISSSSQNQKNDDEDIASPPPPASDSSTISGGEVNNSPSSSAETNATTATIGGKAIDTSSLNKSSNKTIWIIAGVVVGIIGLVLLVVFFRSFYFGGKLGGGKLNISHKGDGKFIGLRVGRNKHDSTDDEDDDEDGDWEETTIPKGLSGDCVDKYNKLLEINGFDFDKYCINQNIRSQNYQEQKINTKPQNIVLIFDASGSMGARIGGQRKIDIAKEATKKFIDQIAGDENTNLDIIVYGHKGSNSASQKTISCNGIEEIYHLGGVHANVAKSKLDNFNATGWTPIADSLKKAKQILVGHKDEHNFILLVSDGKETCGGSPVGVINDIKSSGTNIKVNVIGFDVTGDDADQLEAIAKAGDGNYFDAKNAYDMEIAFRKHKQMLNKADFKIGSAIEQLYDISFVINTYNQCRVMLYKEYVAMMLDVHAHKLAGTRCEDSIDEKYKERFDSIMSKIETNYQTDKAKFDALR